MKEVKDRDAQFKNISSIRTACWKIRFPMISIDTKKKELIGKFKRNGKVLIKTQQKSLDYELNQYLFCSYICRPGEKS